MQKLKLSQTKDDARNHAESILEHYSQKPNYVLTKTNSTIQPINKTTRQIKNWIEWMLKWFRGG